MERTVVAVAAVAAAPSDATVASLGPASARPAFRRDDTDFDMPLGGVILLGALVGIAAAVVWRRSRIARSEGAVGSVPARWRDALVGGRHRAGDAELRLLASRRLDGSARVHVLACGGRRYLVGCNGQHAIGVLACLDGPIGDAGVDARSPT